ncbi:MAG TPA: hypothetical protein VK277_14225 [Acidimicrobiales bacterium]|nr:hypothetical protein [Acidimicrobiales bacterium]
MSFADYRGPAIFFLQSEGGPEEIKIVLAQPEVKLFSQDPPLTQEQADRASASFAQFFDQFFDQLPEDERAVLTQVLRRAAEAGDAET